MARTRVLAASFVGLVALVVIVVLAVLPSRTPDSTGQPSTGQPAPEISGVHALVESASFLGSGDISDDSAIWVDPDNPANSVVVADNKADDGGIGVFGMDGKLIDFRPDGKIGNIDLRTGFSLSGVSEVLIAGNNRTRDTLALWSLDTVSRTLKEVHAGSIATVAPNYGACMYHSRASGKFYAFVTPAESGAIQQFELSDNGDGKVQAKLVRSLDISSTTESCVADDELAHLYVGQEDVAVWKYGAEPDDGTDRIAVDSVEGGRLAADIEGMAIAYEADGSGYLFVSSQGDSTLAVYERSGSNSFVKKIKIGANGGIDEVSGTDGIDVTNLDAGPGFEHGLLVVHDEDNKGGTTSNLKYVPLSAVLE